MQSPLENEIEIKLLVADGADNIIQQRLLPALAAKVEMATLQLSNDYYDSPARSFRKHEMGFRVRSSDSYIEQTLKTKGATIGGLHQRPEYNIALQQAKPELALFSKEIWPPELNVAELQDQLILMFSTNFTRHIYLLTFADESQIELVWDKGSISTQGQSLALCELELELKKGKAEHLFSLAKTIAKLMPLRIGNASKAARGYALVDSLTNKPQTLPAHLAKNTSIETAFIQAMEFSLGYWQHHEALYHEDASTDALKAMYQGMQLLANTMAIYQQALPWTALPNLQSLLKDCLAKWQWLESMEDINKLSSQDNTLATILLKTPRVLRYFNNRAEALINQYEPQDGLSQPSHIVLQLELAQALFDKPWRHDSEGCSLSHQDFSLKVLQDNTAGVFADKRAWTADDYLLRCKDIKQLQQRAFLLSPLLSHKQGIWQDIGPELEKLQLYYMLQKQVTEQEAQTEDNDMHRLAKYCCERINQLVLSMEDSRKTNSALLTQPKG